MNWIVSMFGQWRVQRAFELELKLRFAERRAMRPAQSQRVKAGQLAAQRKAWAKDPVRNEMRGAGQ
jgi:hypothetical protein